MGVASVSDLRQRAEDILASPMGCAFFADARERGYLPEDLADPAVSLRLAAEAVDMVERWLPDHEQVVAEMLGLAPVIRPLVEATLAHEGTAWWYEGPDLDTQVWIPHDGETPDPSQWKRPNTPPSRWERYAQKPLGPQYTTTLFEHSASMLIAYENHTGDIWPESWPLQCWLMRMPADVKIYEIHGPEDWHRSRVPEGGVTGTRWQEESHRVILIGTTTNPMREDRDGQEQHGPFGTTTQARHGR